MNKKPFIIKNWWKITAAIAALSFSCAIMEIANKSFSDSILWLCLAVTQLELMMYKRDEEK